MNVKEYLLELSDEKYKSFHSNLCPGTNNILGVRVPVLRRYAKELNSKYSLEYLLFNIKDEYYEEIMLKGMLIGLNVKKDFCIITKYIKEFVPKINNWAVCDTFCAGLKITKRHKKEMFEFIKEYFKSNKEFEIRFAVVMILDYYIDEEHIEEDFRIFNEIESDKYYVKMAVAWAISFCIIKFYNKTIYYLKNNKSLDLWTYNKAIQKAMESYRIDDEKKYELKKLKRK